MIIIGAGIFALPIVGNDNLHRFELSGDAYEPQAVPDRLCFGKTTNQPLVGGELFDRVESAFSIDHPDFSIFAGDAVNEISDFRITPKLTCISGIGSSVDQTQPIEDYLEQFREKIDACKQDKIGTNCDSKDGFITMVVEESELSVKIISEDNILDTKVITYIDTVVIPEQELVDGSEIKLTTFEIPFGDIEDDLSGGTYSSWHEFRVFGTLTLHPVICEECTFTYYIPEEGMPTFYETIIKKAEGDVLIIDSDNDGVADTNNSGKQNDALAKEEENQNTKSKSLKEGIESATEFGDCLLVGDTECLNQGKFAMLWFAVAGLIGLGIFGTIISLLTRNRNN